VKTQTHVTFIQRIWLSEVRHHGIFMRLPIPGVVRILDGKDFLAIALVRVQFPMSNRINRRRALVGSRNSGV